VLQAVFMLKDNSVSIAKMIGRIVYLLIWVDDLTLLGIALYVPDVVARNNPTASSFRVFI
jgi:hypothetical protein